MKLLRTSASTRPSSSTRRPSVVPNASQAAADGFTKRRRRAYGDKTRRSRIRRSVAFRAPARSSAATTVLKYSLGASRAQNSAKASAPASVREASMKQFVSSTNLRSPAAIRRQSMRESARPRNARAPLSKSLRNATKSSATSTASRSVDTPSDSRASSRSRGSSQKAFRTFPRRVARGAGLMAPVRALRPSAARRLTRVDVGTGILRLYATGYHVVRTTSESLALAPAIADERLWATERAAHAWPHGREHSQVASAASSNPFPHSRVASRLGSREGRAIVPSGAQPASRTSAKPAA